MIQNNIYRTNTQNAGHLLAILGWLILFIIGTVTASVLVVDIMAKELENPNTSFWLIVTACYCLGFVILITANALKHHRAWARYLGSFLAFVTLIAFPVGTVLGLFILSYINKGWTEQ